MVFWTFGKPPFLWELSRIVDKTKESIPFHIKDILISDIPSYHQPISAIFGLPKHEGVIRTHIIFCSFWNLGICSQSAGNHVSIARGLPPNIPFGERLRNQKFIKPKYAIDNVNRSLTEIVASDVNQIICRWQTVPAAKIHICNAEIPSQLSLLLVSEVGGLLGKNESRIASGNGGEQRKSAGRGQNADRYGFAFSAVALIGFSCLLIGLYRRCDGVAVSWGCPEPC